MTNTAPLAKSLHDALLRARDARASVLSARDAASLAVSQHAQAAPVTFNESAAAAELARAEFDDRINGTDHAAAVRDRIASDRQSAAAAQDSHQETADRLAAELRTREAELQAADAAIADLTASRTSVVAKAAGELLKAEQAGYADAVADVLARAARVIALRTIATEPERDPRQARRFDASAVTLPTCTGDALAERAREQFAVLTDELCGVVS